MKNYLDFKESKMQNQAKQRNQKTIVVPENISKVSLKQTKKKTKIIPVLKNISPKFESK